jgi:uncharacterized protein YdeI (BOF family)
MNKSASSLWYAGTFALALALLLSGVQMQAQQTAPPDQPTQAQPSQQPGQQPAQPRQQAPDSQAQTQSTSSQTFSGTVVKSGDKYVLQDASGTSYDVDRQDLVKKYEGQKVRIHGTLDASGKVIQVQ